MSFLLEFGSHKKVLRSTAWRTCCHAAVLCCGKDNWYLVMGEWDEHSHGCNSVCKGQSVHKAAINRPAKAELSCLLGNVGAAMLRDIHRFFDPIDSILGEALAKALMISVSTDGSKWS